MEVQASEVTRFPLVTRRPLDAGVLEIRVELLQGKAIFHPFMVTKTARGPMVARCSLRGVPSEGSRSSIGQARRVLDQALINISDGRVDVTVKFKGGMEDQGRSEKPSGGSEEGGPSSGVSTVDVMAVLSRCAMMGIPPASAPQALLGSGGQLFQQGNLPAARSVLEQAIACAQLLGDIAVEGMASGNLGLVYWQLKDYDRAIPYHEKDLQVSVALNDLVGEGAASGNLGKTYHSLKDFRRALDYHSRDLEIGFTLRDPVRQLKAYGNLADAYDGLEDYPNAIDYGQKARLLARELHDPVAEEAACAQLGGSCHKRGDDKKALEYYEMTLSFAMANNDRAAIGRAYGNLGVSSRGTGDFGRAKDYHLRHLEIALEHQDLGLESHIYLDLGSACLGLGEVKQAVKYYEEGLELATLLGKQDTQGQLYGSLGNAYTTLGDFRRAVEYHEKDLELTRQVKDRRGEGTAYCNLGAAYDHLGNTRVAIECHSKALQIGLDLQDLEVQKLACGGLGNAFLDLNDLHKAHELFTQSLDFARRIGDQRAVGTSLGSLGVVARRLKRYRDAISYDEQALELMRQTGYREYEGLAYSNLGRSHEALGELEASERYLRQAVDLYAALQRDLGAENQQWQITMFEEQSISYRRLIGVLIAQGKTDEALSMADFGRSSALISLLSLQRASALAPREALSIERLQSISRERNTTFLHYSLVEFPERALIAWVVSPTAVTFHTLDASVLTEGTGVSDSLSQLSRFKREQGGAQAISHGFAAGMEGLANLDITRDDPIVESAPRRTVQSCKKALDEAKTLQDRLVALRDLASAYQSHGQTEPAISISKELEEAAQQCDDPTFSVSAALCLAWAQNELGQGEEALIFSQTAHALALESEDHRRTGHALREQALAHGLLDHKTEAISAANQALTMAREVDDVEGEGRALRALGTLALKWYEPSHGNSNPIGEIDSNSNRGPDLPDPARSFLNALQMASLTGPAERMRTLVGLAEVYERAENFGESLPCYNEALKLGQELDLGNDVARLASARSKVVSALRDQTDRLLTRYYEALIAPLEENLTPESKLTLVLDSSLTTLPFTIFKDSEGAYLIEKYCLTTAPSIEALEELSAIQQQRLDSPQTAVIVGDPQENLLFSQIEAEELAKTFDTEPILGLDATVANVSEKAVDARFLHFSCHGHATKKTHTHSVFEGALGLASDEENQGWWHAEDIQKLPLKAELAFLSSCKSGRGKLQREGVIGLARSFQSAGVPTIIATHWSIPDNEYTVGIIKNFYSHVLKKSPEAQQVEGPIDKAEALCDTITNMLDEHPELREQPEKWGAFFLSGAF